jgi:hypothetical protein
LQRSRQLDIDGAKVRYNDQSVWAGVANPDRLASDGHAESAGPTWTYRK